MFGLCEVFTVEAIRGARTRRGKPEYLIKWRDYGEEMNTWEPQTNILDDNLLSLWKTNK